MKGIEYQGDKNSVEEISATKKDIVYLKIVETIASLSKDKNTKVGCVIIDTKGKVVSMGYNGCVSKFGIHTDCTDERVPHSREPEEIEISDIYHSLGVDISPHQINKYPFMIHAEANALLNTSDMNRLVDATIYCTTFPCATCANMIAQVGIEHVKVLNNKHGTFKETIVPTLFVYENLNISLTVFEKERI